MAEILIQPIQLVFGVMLYLQTLIYFWSQNFFLLQLDSCLQLKSSQKMVEFLTHQIKLIYYT